MKSFKIFERKRSIMEFRKTNPRRGFFILQHLKFIFLSSKPCTGILRKNYPKNVRNCLKVVLCKAYF